MFLGLLNPNPTPKNACTSEFRHNLNKTHHISYLTLYRFDLSCKP